LENFLEVYVFRLSRISTYYKKSNFSKRRDISIFEVEGGYYVTLQVTHFEIFWVYSTK